MDRLRVEREKRGLKQDEVADLIGVSRTTYAGYEQGHRKPDLDTFEKLADLFDCSMDYLKGRSRIPHLTEREDRLISLQALKDARDKIAAGLVVDIPEERIPFIVDKLDTEIEKIEQYLNGQK